MDPYASGIRQHNTHRALAGQAMPGSPWADSLGLDAIIVPGTRPAAYLDHAVTLARAAECWLVILSSQGPHGAEVREYLAARSFSNAVVIDLPPGYSHPMLYFPRLASINNDLPHECGWYATDLSMKRNIGLIMARMLQWRRIFFLDDDIRDFTYPDLEHTVDMLKSFSAAGMWVTKFPDNSIVCHANRETGTSQDVFVSGAALAVDCYSDIGFFPDIYNEDWFFFFDAASNGRLGNSYKRATQLAYYPFANPKRAAWQEFGDVLAEGLYALLHLQLDVRQATSLYWSYFLDARRHFLEGILSRTQNAPPDMRDEIAASVESAQECLRNISPGLCTRYVELWRQDLRDWKRRLTNIPAAGSVEDALVELGLPTARTNRPWRILHPGDEVLMPRHAGPVTLPTSETQREMARHANALWLNARDETQDTLPLDPKDIAALSEARWRRLRRRGISPSRWIGGGTRLSHRSSAGVGTSPSEPETVVPGEIRSSVNQGPPRTAEELLHS
jgi:hypothetical protein